MDLLRCDSCEKPLGEGAFGRGEALRRGRCVLCKACDSATQQAGPALEHHSTTHETQNDRELSCTSCRKQLEENDFIRGTAFRLPQGIRCLNCLPPSLRETSSDAQPTQSSSKSAPKARAPRLQASSLPRPRRHKDQTPAALPVRPQTPAPKSQLTTLSWLALIFVLPVFAISLYTAISAQRERNQAQDERNDLAARLNQTLHDNAQAPLRALPRDENKADHTLPTSPIDADETTGPDGNSNSTPPNTTAQELPETLRTSMIANEVDVARPLLRELESPTIDERLLAMGKIGTRRAIAVGHALATFLTSEHALERQMSARILGQLNHRSAIPSLERLASDDESYDVRQSAKQALAAMAVGGAKHNIALDGYTLEELRALEQTLMHDPTQEKALTLIRREIQDKALEHGDNE